ncbi:MAG: hypothetical protein M5U17_06440 [Ignavibacterium sp.]|nr:hypothetical protein [Ignavibacterium sp.]
MLQDIAYTTGQFDFLPPSGTEEYFMIACKYRKSIKDNERRTKLYTAPGRQYTGFIHNRYNRQPSHSSSRKLWEECLQQ